MPFLGYDPRDLGCFDGLVVPGDVNIPTNNRMSWGCYPEHEWVYDKLRIAISQGLQCSPLGGKMPDKYPVFIKPVYNLFGMGAGTCMARNQEELEACTTPGCFWSEYLSGEHLSFDIVVIEGEPVFQLAFEGHPLSGQRFDYWETVEPPAGTLSYVYAWIRAHLAGFTGCINLETLGGKIIEVHLRMGDIKRIPDQELLQAVVDVYAGKPWRYGKPIPKYYLLVLWGDDDRDYFIGEAQLKEIRRRVALLEMYDPRYRRENPPGALRVAQLGSYDLEQGLQARAALAAALSPPIVSAEPPAAREPSRSAARVEVAI